MVVYGFCMLLLDLPLEKKDTSELSCATER